MLYEIFNLGKHCLDSNIVAAVVALICIIMMLMSFKRTCDQNRLLYWLEVSSVIGVMVTIFGYVLNLVNASALLSTADYAGWNYFMWDVGSTAVYWPIWLVGYLYSKIRRGAGCEEKEKRGQPMKNKGEGSEYQP